jgi:ribosomal protein L11 methyltransferase
MRVWHALELEISRHAEAAIAAQLWASGTTGIEISEDSPEIITLRAWFDSKQDESGMRAQIEHALSIARMKPTSLRSVKAVEVADQDWLAEWKKGYEPVEIGERLLIAPSWKREEVAGSDRIVIEIDPGMAFGTGTHETTRGCLEMLEKHWHGGALLDVGTGTGILAMAAVKLHPGSRVIGFDVDPEAIAVAEENATINGVENEVVFEVDRISSFHGLGFDVVLANLTADVLVPLAEDFARAVRRDGTLIASGILLEQKSDVVEALSEAGFALIEEKPDGEWVTLALKSDKGNIGSH